MKTGEIDNEERLSEILNSLLGQVWRTISIWYWYREEIFHWRERNAFCKGIRICLNWQPRFSRWLFNWSWVFLHSWRFFDRILATEQDSDITLNLIHRETSLPSINVKISSQRSEKCSMSEMVTPLHQIQRKRRKQINDHSQKSIDDFELVLVTQSPKSNRPRKEIC